MSILLKQLRKAIKDTSDESLKNVADIMMLIKLQNELGNCFVKANNFILNNGKETFDTLLQSTPKGQYIKLFKKFEKTFTDEEYWENLIYTYTIQDYQQNDYQFYIRLFSSKRKSREKMMSPEEQDFFNNLPDTITIYRGGSVSETKKGYGISWTLNKDIAAKFVNIKKSLSDDTMIIHEIEIPKQNVVAYVNGRKEEEIIYLGEL
jgi:hypothetical protein